MKKGHERSAMHKRVNQTASKGLEQILRHMSLSGNAKTQPTNLMAFLQIHTNMAGFAVNFSAPALELFLKPETLVNTKR